MTPEVITKPTILREPDADFHYVIIGTIYSHWMDFHAYPVLFTPGEAVETLGIVDNGNHIVDVSEVLDTPRDDLALIHGSVKWDGCCNVNFEGGDGLHFCGLDDTKELGKVFEAIYEEAHDIECWLD